MYRKHLFTLSITLIIVMLFSALGPTTVYADDGPPPDASAGEASDPGDEAEAQAEDSGGDEVEESVSEEEPSDEAVEGEAEEAATEEADGGETEEAVTTVEDAAEATGEGEVEETATEETGEEAVESDVDTAAEEPSLMEQVPDNTEIVVVNAEGEAEPLATQEAAEAVVNSDPIWCPAGQGPTPGANGCTDSYSSFDDLLTFLKADEAGAGGTGTYQGNGTIYVEMGVYGGGESAIDFNTYGFTTFDDNDLTIQGGWNTTSGTTTDTTTFNVPIVIGSDTTPWGGSLTLRNIIITDVGDNTALTVYSNGDVTVEDSEVKSNDVNGDEFYNRDGVYIEADGDVNIRNTNVNNNGSDNWNEVNGTGLEIVSGGEVTLLNVQANDNQIFGADILATNDVFITDSFFNGNLMYTTDFTEYFGYGLKVVSLQGEISMSGVEANDNFLWGAGLDGAYVYIQNSIFDRNVSDSVSFIDDTGLVIVSDGGVDLLNIEANENRMMGAEIFANGQVNISDSSFDNNFGSTVDASGGDVFWGCGLQVSGDPVGGFTIGDLQIQNCDPKNQSSASINLITVTANGNYLYGADLYATGNVNISNSGFSNNATPADQANAQGGLMVSGGDVTLNTVTADENRMFGADISATGTINIENSSFSNNLNGSGLLASTPTGTIILTDVIALGNGGDGADLETNCDIFVWGDVNGSTFAGNTQYGINAVTRSLNLNLGLPTVFTPANGTGETNVSAPSGACPTATSPNPSAAYTIIVSLTQGQLPAALGSGNAFVSALQVSGQITNGITLSFPIPAGMENADLAVMFWNGSAWVEVSGGSVVGDAFVITVNQPGIYVLVSKLT